MRSPPVRGRGSKRLRSFSAGAATMSPPVRGRGSKHFGFDAVWKAAKSPPVRGRGSKPPPPPPPMAPPSSPPVRGRGSKRHRELRRPPDIPVAPRAGAWIETMLAPAPAHDLHRRPPCGGVDRNSCGDRLMPLIASRPPCGGVDRNAQTNLEFLIRVHVAPRAGA